MKSTVLGLLMVFMTAMGVHAQTQPLKVQLETEYSQFLAQEPLVIKMRVINYTGETLKMGDDPDWVNFSVEPVGNKGLVRQNGPLDIVYPFVLETSMMATKRINLIPQFEIMKPGRYKIMARVKAGRWGEISSDPLLIDIVGGNILWEQEFGVPDSTGKEPEIRKYKLIQSRQMDASVLYVKVTDIYESKVYGIHPLGKMVLTPIPEKATDKANRLHVLQQSGAKSFTYSMINHDGTVLIRMRYEYDDTRPRLRASESGDIIIAGGIRVKSEYDIDPLADQPAQPSTTP
jgi:hypothetical protein